MNTLEDDYLRVADLSMANAGLLNVMTRAYPDQIVYEVSGDAIAKWRADHE